MYFIEWMLWHIQTSRLESETWQKKLEQYLKDKHTGKYKHEDSLPGIQDRAGETPNANGSIYSFNENYIEIKAGSLGEYRGIITYISLFTLYFLYESTKLALLVNSSWLTGNHFWLKQPATLSDYLTGLFIASMTGGLFYVVIRYARVFFRLENFVQRRFLIRFNRITRQVYLHRPGFAGGITVLDWEQVAPESVLGQEESANIGRQLVLLWDPATTGLPHLHLMFVGKTADGTSDLVNLWEFIRRYMEEGPQSVPAPKKLLGKVPWPWQSVMASLSFFRPLWRAGLRWQVACWVALASPALLIHASGHWVSLLLCWEPRWPRIIREAGLPGKPVPPLSTTADWPPLPVVKPKTKKPRRTRKSPAADQGQAEQAVKGTADSPSEKSPADSHPHQKQEL